MRRRSDRRTAELRQRLRFGDSRSLDAGVSGVLAAQAKEGRTALLSDAPTIRAE
jgi:hypothetical protein